MCAWASLESGKISLHFRARADCPPTISTAFCKGVCMSIAENYIQVCSKSTNLYVKRHNRDVCMIAGMDTVAARLKYARELRGLSVPGLARATQAMGTDIKY